MHPGEGLAEPAEAPKRSASAEEGRRLVHAFFGIKDAELRDSIVSLLEKMSQVYVNSEGLIQPWSRWGDRGHF